MLKFVPNDEAVSHIPTHLSESRMRIPESELIINSDGSAFHLHLRPEEIADDIILVGDQNRVDLFKDFLSDIEFDIQAREFHSITGQYNGKRVTVLSTGIGTDNIDIVINELDALANIDFSTRLVKDKHRALNILRLGTSGGIQPDIPLGTYLFSSYSLGTDGLLNWYGDRDNYCDKDLEKAFLEQVHWDRRLPAPYFVKASDYMSSRFEGYTTKGITISAPGFYGPQGRVVRIPVAMPDMLSEYEKFRYGDYRLTNFEMEGSAIAGLSAHLGHNAGTVCCIIANRFTQNAKTDYAGLMKGLVGLSLDRLTSD